jgi:hypothetical protein
MGFASLEPGIQGPWPKAKYQELTRIEGQILSALGLLSGSFARLQPKWCKLLAERSAMMHPAFVSHEGRELLCNATRSCGLTRNH